jgi:tartrate dehydratase alpha subunit/fumarate hydratase class I-like protein
MFEEKNTKNNLPAQIDIYEEGTDSYDFFFVAKGGGSANKTFFYQGTPTLLTHDRMIEFLKEKILTFGTAACPPYHLAIVIGGTSAEVNVKTVKLASTRYLDDLPTEGSESGHAFRDLEMEKEIHKLWASAPSSAGSTSATTSASSDIYSLGVTFVNLVSGDLWFLRDGRSALLAANEDGDPYL